MKKLALIAATIALASCAQLGMSPAPVAAYKDGELPLPVDYKTWPKFLSEVQRPDIKQIREIYVNPVGNKSVKGQPFPNGTRFVMELYAAKVGADGQLEKGADGKLVKANLANVFVMGKEDGWNKQAPEGMKNGDWIYAQYSGKDNTAVTTANFGACRACHMPLEKDDYVFRYDEYFQKRAAMTDQEKKVADALRQQLSGRTVTSADAMVAAHAFVK